MVTCNILISFTLYLKEITSMASIIVCKLSKLNVTGVLFNIVSGNGLE